MNLPKALTLVTITIGTLALAFHGEGEPALKAFAVLWAVALAAR